MSSVPASKDALVLAINNSFLKLMVDYRSVPESLSRECGIDGNIKGTMISVCDTAAYLIGWGRLIIKWYDLKAQGKNVDFPETGYKWNQLGELAQHFHNEYRQWAYNDLLNELEKTTNNVLLLIQNLTNQELYHQPWYEKWSLGRMIQFNTSSPMKNIRIKVRRFKVARVSDC